MPLKEQQKRRYAVTKDKWKRSHSNKLLISYGFLPSISDLSGYTIATFPEEVIFFVKVSIIFTYGYGKTFFLEIRFLLFTDGGFLQHLKRKQSFLSWNLTMSFILNIMYFENRTSLACLRPLSQALSTGGSRGGGGGGNSSAAGVP